MKMILTIMAFVALGITTSFAQNLNNDPQVSINNYKHLNKSKKAISANSQENLTSKVVALISQRTNKAVKRNYIMAPVNANVATHVQGQKTKANYKNQFN